MHAKNPKIVVSSHILTNVEREPTYRHFDMTMAGANLPTEGEQYERLYYQSGQLCVESFDHAYVSRIYPHLAKYVNTKIDARRYGQPVYVHTLDYEVDPVIAQLIQWERSTIRYTAANDHAAQLFNKAPWYEQVWSLIKSWATNTGVI